MNMLVKCAAAALLVSGATVVMAQQDDQKRPARPLPENTSKSPTEPKDAAPGVGSRPMGPAAESSTSNSENDKKAVTPKKLEEQGKSGNR
jgi:hypothetical protein